ARTGSSGPSGSASSSCRGRRNACGGRSTRDGVPCAMRMIARRGSRASRVTRRAGRVALVVAAAGALALLAPVTAQDAFYKGKVIRIVVGFTAGGGFDTYSRTIARHMGRHVPGNPTIVVENMPGAGSLISANYLYKIAKPDGLTIGHFIGGLLLGQ